MSSPDIDLMLTCTTAHITNEDNLALHRFAGAHAEAPDTSEHFVANLGYGYVIWVNSDGDFTEYKGKMSDAFLGLMGFAYNQGVQFLRFDRDALELDGFPTFDW
jgi:hypothetical protein